MNDAERLIARAGVHPEWHDLLEQSLATLEPGYLRSLCQDERWLPGADHLLAAFRRDRSGLRYLLIGESPYPRRESANGIAFYDAAVIDLWSESGLSKAVNRATSLRNIVKTALLAEGHLTADQDGKLTQTAIATLDRRALVQTLPEMFDNLQQAGFLMINATPVLHPERKPAQEARHWQSFLARLLQQLSAQPEALPTLLLWGKIAAQVEAIPASQQYRKLICEHPYNLSFIDNADMRALFAATAPLAKRNSC